MYFKVFGSQGKLHHVLCVKVTCGCRSPAMAARHPQGRKSPCGSLCWASFENISIWAEALPAYGQVHFIKH